MIVPPEFAWINGEIVPWDQCVVHARTQGAFWGANVFEGIRGYWEESAHRMNLFLLDEHLSRLKRSMKSIRMISEYSDLEIQNACSDVVNANRFEEDIHLCIVAYFGMGSNFDPLCHTTDSGMHITAIRSARSKGYYNGIKACTSSWRRISDDTMPPRIKTGANYHNSRLAQHEAVRNGYDTAIFINNRGTIAEAPGSCLIMVHNDKFYTPPGTSGVLEGITVSTIERIIKDKMSLSLERRELDRTELYCADELFICGTLAEIQPIISFDGITIGEGKPGILTQELQRHYESAVRTSSEVGPEFCLSMG